MKHFHTLLRGTAGLAAAAISAGILLVPSVVFAEEEDNTFDDGTLTYTILDSSTVSVTGCKETTSYVSIMPKIDGYDVVSIGEEAFANCDLLRSITIPSSVTEIGSAAFYGCTALEEIALPDAVTTIDSGTFFNCSALTKITLGDAVTSIGDMAFGYCTALTDITLPDSVETLGDQLFYYCTALESIEIPAKVTELGAYTFYGCLSLTEFHIPATLEDIGAMTFLGCNQLKTITADEGNPNYAVFDNALYNTDYTVLYVYPAGRGDTAFELPESVLVVYAGAFFAAQNLQQITFHDNLQYIGEMAFDFCSGLTSVTIPESVTTIGTTAFADCSALTSVTFAGTEREDGGEGDDLEIGEYAFFCCDSLKEITLPKRVTSIGDYAFGCTSADDDEDSENVTVDSDTELAVKPLDGFLLIGYTGVASDYVKNSSVDLNFKPVNFNWGKLVFWIVAAAVVLLIVFFAIRIIRRNMLSTEEKRALRAAQQEQKKPLSERQSSDAELEEEPDDGYVSILEDDVEEEESILSYDETISHSRTHQFGHAAQEESEPDKKIQQ